MKFSQLFSQLRKHFSQPVFKVNFWSTLVNSKWNNSIKSSELTVDQNFLFSQPAMLLTYPPIGGSQLVNFGHAL